MNKKEIVKIRNNVNYYISNIEHLLNSMVIGYDCNIRRPQIAKQKFEIVKYDNVVTEDFNNLKNKSSYMNLALSLLEFLNKYYAKDYVKILPYL